MGQNDTSSKLAIAIQNAMKVPLLVELGSPCISSDEIALAWLHLGATYLKFSIIADLGEFFCKRSGVALSKLGFGRDISVVGSAKTARCLARDAYSEAISENPNLAEAHFGLARSIQIQNHENVDLDCAILHFRRCVELQTHSLTPPHAFLHANAHWEIACLFEKTERDDEALTAFRKALSLQPIFGVHQIRVARFFRKLGLHEEASAQYLICSHYNHRYFPEFILPPLVSNTPQASRATTDFEEVFNTLAGESIYFDNGTYILVPSNEIWTEESVSPSNKSVSHAGRVGAFLDLLQSKLPSRKSQNNFRRAESIVELVNK